MMHPFPVAMSVAGPSGATSRHARRFRLAGGAVGSGNHRRYTDVDLCALWVARVLEPENREAGQIRRRVAVEAVVAAPRRFVAVSGATALTFATPEEAPAVVRQLGGGVVTIVDLSSGPQVVAEAVDRLAALAAVAPWPRWFVGVA